MFKIDKMTDKQVMAVGAIHLFKMCGGMSKQGRKQAAIAAIKMQVFY